MVVLGIIAFLLLLIIIIILVLKISSGINERLSAMECSLQETHKTIGQNLGNSTAVFGNVQEKLGRLEETNRQICEISKDISSLQELLRAPKLRGQIGELMLDNLLSQVLPKEHYHLQYRFKTQDTVDAVVKIGERLIPVDAKFSLENFQKIMDSSDDQAKNNYRKKFVQDVKNRIDEISSKYILPSEDTYDFGLMYIPAENVYYEIIINQDLFFYSTSRKVIPVSGNTLYIYLQVICMGLKGFKVEENAKIILNNLSMLSNEIGKLKDDFDVLGGHILNASRKYEDTQKRLTRFSDKLIDIQDTKTPEIK